MDKTFTSIRPINIEDEIRSSYLDYSMSVIVGRALPDVRDGLKPVHRRVLYAMHELGNEWNKAYKKSARIVGDVIGKYHPHGDSSVYDALVRLAQEWALRYPLVDGQGNFGSVDGDPPAAMRYTEVRMARIASELLADIDKETVDWQTNYDESLLEPMVLPSRIPNLLINGSSGIAVGMSTNIPPHNLREVVDAAIALIDNPELTSLDLMRYVPGPDFPTSGIIAGREAIARAYTTGRGIIVLRGRIHAEKADKSGRENLIITEIPYQLNKVRLIETIADLIREKRIEGISDLRDESSREGMRIVMELKRDANSEILMRQLYKLTPLESSFGIINLAIVEGQPEVLTLKALLKHYISHRKEVIIRRTKFELRKAEERAHILEGFKIALDNLDAVIETIRSSPSPVVARELLIERFGLSERQAKEILELRLQRLTGLEREKILEEYRDTLRIIARLREILADEALVFSMIKDDLAMVREMYGDERRTEIMDIDTGVTDEDLIPEEDMVVTISHQGYIKRTELGEFRSQKRGGRGKMGMAIKEEDFVRDVFVASTHSFLLIFTRKGRLYWRKVYALPAVGRSGKGKPIVNLIELDPQDSVAAILPVRQFEEGKIVVMTTRNGVIKRTDLQEFSNPRTAGIIASTVDEGDEIIAVKLMSENEDILLSSANGMAIRFPSEEVRVMGRGARGVRGMQLEDGDKVIGMEAVKEGDVVLTITAKGYGKRTALDEYRRQGRGGMGTIDIKTGERNGPVVGMMCVAEDSHVLLITDTGRILRTTAREIRLIGRNTLGVAMMRLDEGERLVAVAPVADTETETEEEGGEPDEN